jgi:hypothetical protein
MSQVWWKIILIATITDLLSSQITVCAVVTTVLVITDRCGIILPNV